jgi:hypothetical protein
MEPFAAIGAAQNCLELGQQANIRSGLDLTMAIATNIGFQSVKQGNNIILVVVLVVV